MFKFIKHYLKITKRIVDLEDYRKAMRNTTFANFIHLIDKPDGYYWHMDVFEEYTMYYVISPDSTPIYTCLLVPGDHKSCEIYYHGVHRFTPSPKQFQIMKRKLKDLEPEIVGNFNV